MIMKKKILLFIASALIFSSCDDLFEPALENQQGTEQMYDDPEYARGILHNVYSLIPGYYDYLDDYPNIKNLFLENADEVKWSDDEEMNSLFARRMKGEAYGLRGMFYYYLMRAHAGFGENGELLGVPLITEYQTSQSDFNLPRASFQACLSSIYSDLAQAETLLPLEYEDASTVPVDFQSLTMDASKYNNVMGAKARQLFNGLIAKAFRVRTALLAASPLYQDASNDASWADAANAAADVLDYKGGKLANDGIEYYSAAIVNKAQDGINPDEILWRAGRTSGDNTQESQNFPPSLYGTGYMNPSQNLVDAFPMANGYPIDNVNGSYNVNAPYTDRDPRLSKYILYNGSTISEKGVNINIISSSADGINVTENRSTRTGYYMKKRLRMDVNCDPAATSKQPHYDPRIRFTEMFLAYAEAANEAWGPKEKNDRNYSAYDIIKAIRKRAGVGGANDPYLEECAADQDKMRELIRNERRLELCFEGFRFWDVRRWKLDLNEPVYGLEWNGNGYRRITVEERSYEDYMYYCPIPNSEVLKYSNLIQNKGWK